MAGNGDDTGGDDGGMKVFWQALTTRRSTQPPRETTIAAPSPVLPLPTKILPNIRKINNKSCVYVCFFAETKRCAP